MHPAHPLQWLNVAVTLLFTSLLYTAAATRIVLRQQLDNQQQQDQQQADHHLYKRQAELKAGRALMASSTVSAGCAATCLQTAVQYIPSALEEAWAANGEKWGASRQAYCDQMTLMKQETAACLGDVAALNQQAIIVGSQSGASANHRRLTTAVTLQSDQAVPLQGTSPGSSDHASYGSNGRAAPRGHLQELARRSLQKASGDWQHRRTGSFWQRGLREAGGGSSVGEGGQSLASGALHPTLSRFVRTYTCSGGADGGSRQVIKDSEWIEPLFAALRSPNAVRCDDTALAEKFVHENATALMDVSYILMAAEAMPKPGHSLYIPHKRAYYLDAGASLFPELSQKWMLGEYEKRGVTFDRIILWEAKTHSPEKIFDAVPPRFMAAYSYLNIRINTDLADTARNPLALIKHIARPEDFVVFKLDIDHYGIENELLAQIAQDPEIYSRIDELYHEPHFAFEPLVKCCWRQTANPNMHLQGALLQLQALRKLGIRVHGWP